MAHLNVCAKIMLNWTKNVPWLVHVAFNPQTSPSPTLYTIVPKTSCSRKRFSIVVRFWWRFSNQSVLQNSALFKFFYLSVQRTDCWQLTTSCSTLILTISTYLRFSDTANDRWFLRRSVDVSQCAFTLASQREQIVSIFDSKVRTIPRFATNTEYSSLRSIPMPILIPMRRVCWASKTNDR